MFHYFKMNGGAGQSWDASASAHHAHWLILAERGFHQIDKLDYLIRRTILDHPPHQSPRTSPEARGRLSDLQMAIARYLRAEYDLAQPIPDRLLALATAVDHSA
jgi:hypothetical protein